VSVGRSTSAAGALALQWYLSLVLLGVCGCVGLRGAVYLFSPQHIQKPEFTLTSGKLVILVDVVAPGEANPVFESSLHEELVRQMREFELPTQVVPYEQLVTLRQTNPGFRDWSVQRVGRQLEADQVLYIRVDRLQLGGRDEPLVSPAVKLCMKVVGVREPAANARLWPDPAAEPDGRCLTHERTAKEAGGPEVLDAEAAKLAREVAYYILRPFRKWDLEEVPPREP
jgi:hypothetical protein